MTARIATPFRLAPDTLKAMTGVEESLHRSPLGDALLELVKLRASQINGCAFCIHMHTTALRRKGEDEMRLYLLPAWREAAFYTERERAALAWTEALTRIETSQAPDEDYARLAAVFEEAEIVELTLAIGAINLWNRLQIGLRIPAPVDSARDAA